MHRFHLPVLLALYLAAPLAGVAQTIQCWTDEKGKRACGDLVPPQYAKRERQVLNKDGLVVETLSREKTAAELAAEAEAAQRELEKKRRVEEQAKYDRSLLETYSTLQDLEEMRSGRLAALDYRLKLAQKTIADGDKTLAEFRSRADKLKAEGKPPNAELQGQIAQYERLLKDNREAVGLVKRERAETSQRFTRDIARYRELRGLDPVATGN